MLPAGLELGVLAISNMVPWVDKKRFLRDVQEGQEWKPAVGSTGRGQCREM
jgi:hypothetical protein